MAVVDAVTVVGDATAAEVVITDAGGSKTQSTQGFYSSGESLEFTSSLNWDGLSQEASDDPGTIIDIGDSEVIHISAGATSRPGSSPADLPDGTNVTLQLLSGESDVSVYATDPVTGTYKQILGAGAATSITWTKTSGGSTAFFPSAATVLGVASDGQSAVLQLVVDNTSGTNGPTTSPAPAKPATNRAKAVVPGDYRIQAMKVNHNSENGAMGRAEQTKPGGTDAVRGAVGRARQASEIGPLAADHAAGISDAEVDG